MVKDMRNRLDGVAKALAEVSEWSETAVAVVFASRVETALERKIRATMRPDLSATLHDRLFRHYGPLKTFSGKIDIAHAFSIISPEAYNDLRAIKDIRNRFAHSQNVLHFNSAELQPLLQKLSGWTAKTKQIELYMDRCIFRAVEILPEDHSSARR